MRRTYWALFIGVFLICSARVGAAETDSITGKSDDGAYIALDDGTKWLVAKSDQKTSASWVAADDVVTVDSSNSCSATELVNVDEDNEAVCAINASSYTSSITDKSDDGAYVDDGSQWIVAGGDTSTSGTWTVGDDVIAFSNSRFCSRTELINTDDDGDEVCASPVRSN